MFRMTCPECGLSLVPLGGEDVCLEFCDQCDSHECECGETELLDDDGVWVDTGVPAQTPSEVVVQDPQPLRPMPKEGR